MVISHHRTLLLISIFVAVLFLVSFTIFFIKPLERLHQLQDRRLLAGAEELLLVVGNYYKVFFEYPWEVLGEPAPTGTVAQSPWLWEVVDKEVASPDWGNQPLWNLIYITCETPTIYACFNPLSSKFQQEARRQKVLDCSDECRLCLSFTSE